MIPYFSRRIDANEVGLRIVEIECEKCSCRYGYELARMGTGHGTAHYGIGADSAAQSARARSLTELQSRLTQEAELVPCPQCHWVSRALLQGYRRGLYRGSGWMALGIAGFGSLASCIAAYYVSIGPAADQAGWPYILIGGPLLFLSLAGILWLIIKWLRSRIDPNRHYPLVPKLPPGTPPALVYDSENQEWRFATADSRDDLNSKPWLEFQIGRHALPMICCGCLQEASLDHAYKRPIGTAFELQVPRCPVCAREQWWARMRIWFLTSLALTGVNLGVIWLSGLDIREPLITGTGIVLAWLIAAFVASTRTSPVKIRDNEFTRGVLSLRFQNQAYQSRVGEFLNTLEPTSLTGAGPD